LTEDEAFEKGKRYSGVSIYLKLTGQMISGISRREEVKGSKRGGFISKERIKRGEAW